MVYASKLTNSHILKLFGDVIHTNCPIQHDKDSGLDGEEHAEWNDVFTELARSMKLSTSDVKEVSEISQQDVPHCVLEDCNGLVELWNILMTDVKFDESDQESRLESYKRLSVASSPENMFDFYLTKGTGEIGHIISQLHRFCMYFLTRKKPGNCTDTNLHTVWTTIWNGIMRLTTQLKPVVISVKNVKKTYGIIPKIM